MRSEWEVTPIFTNKLERTKYILNLYNDKYPKNCSSRNYTKTLNHIHKSANLTRCFSILYRRKKHIFSDRHKSSSRSYSHCLPDSVFFRLISEQLLRLYNRKSCRHSWWWRRYEIEIRPSAAILTTSDRPIQNLWRNNDPVWVDSSNITNCSETNNASGTYWLTWTCFDDALAR